MTYASSAVRVGMPGIALLALATACGGAEHEHRSDRDAGEEPRTDAAADREGSGDASTGATDDVRVLIGTPDDDLNFIPLMDGADLPLATFGQGGTHVTLSVRCVGFGLSAFVDVTLENLDTGKTVTTVPTSRPERLVCLQGVPGCDLAPLYVMTFDLAAPAEKDGLRIRVTADVRNEQGLSASASIEGVLRRDGLSEQLAP